MNVEDEGEGSWADVGGGDVFVLVLRELTADPKVDIYHLVHSRVEGPHRGEDLFH